MSEDSLIRLENLRNTKLRPTELVRRCGSSVAYWSDLIAGRKSFGEKTARKIEAGLGLPRGSMDQPGLSMEQSAPPPAGPSYDAQSLGYYLDKITDPDQRAKTARAALQLILRQVDGPPPEPPIPEPEPVSKTRPATHPSR